MTAGFTGGFSPVLYPLSLEFHKDLTATTGLITWPLLVNGLGTPGVRPLVSFDVVSIIWAAVSVTFGSLLGARIVAAFAGPSTEALAVATINDIFFLHERGSKMGVYVVIFGAGNSLPPLVAGFMAGTVGWRWFAWLSAIVAGLNFAAIFFPVPESRFNRTPEELTPSIPTDTVVDEDKRTFGDGGANTKNSTSGTDHRHKEDSLARSQSLVRSDQGIIPQPLHASIPSGPVSCGSLGIARIFSALGLATRIGHLELLHFQAPPYKFSPGINGLINIPALLSSFFRGFTGGYLNDVYARSVARRNGGCFIAESRLVMLVIPGLTVAAGLLMFGIGADKKLHSMVLYVGYAFQSAAVGVSGLGMTYVLDNYFEVAPEAVLMVNGTMNVVAWGFFRGFIPWTTKSGYAVVFGAMTGIWLGLLVLAVPLYFFDARMRTYTARKFRIIFW